MVRVLFLVLALTLLPRNSAAQRFEQLTIAPGPSPEARRHASAIYDPVDHRMIVFGGQTAAGRVADIWALDIATLAWTDLTPSAGAAPAGRRTPGSVYDPDNHRMITWSGQGAGVFFNDVWSFDLGASTWMAHTPVDTIPNPRYGVAVVFDPVAKELVTFAGFTTAGRFDDTWRFDAAASDWDDARPVTQSPPMRCLHSASYDAVGHRMIMYGGQQSGPLDDLWAFDLTTDTWTDITPTVRPAGRFFAAHVHDSRDRRSIIFGGTRGAAGGNTNELWAFDLAAGSWEELLPSGIAPSARQGSSAIYLHDEDRMLIFGGHDGAYLDEVWAVEEISGGPTDVPSLANKSQISLEPGQPNPFNPRTSLFFTHASSGRMRLSIYDLAGRQLVTLLDEHREAGRHEVVWEGRDAQGRSLASGVYLARVTGAGGSATTKLVLAK